MKLMLLAASALLIAAPALAQDAAAPAADPLALATDADWRALDPENTLILTIAKAGAPTVPAGTVVIEMAPEFAPMHVERVKTLARAGFYDGRLFARVIDDFMAQAGALPGNEEGGPSPYPDIEAEFITRMGADKAPYRVEELRLRNPREANSPETEAGYLDGFPVGYQPAAQTMVSTDGKRDMWLVHCPGAVAAARTSDPNSGNFQFYITRNETPWLDGSYTVWGAVRQGYDAVMSLATGEPAPRPDLILSLRVASDLDADEYPQVQVLDTDSEAFNAYVIQERRMRAPLGVCDVTVPTRVAD